MVLDNGYITVFMFCWIIKHGPSGWYDHKTATTVDQPVYSAWSWLIVVNNGDSWPRWWCSWDLPFGNLQNPRTTGGGENHRQKCWKFSVATFDDRRIQWSNQAFKMALKMAADLFFQSWMAFDTVDTDTGGSERGGELTSNLWLEAMGWWTYIKSHVLPVETNHQHRAYCDIQCIYTNIIWSTGNEMSWYYRDTMARASSLGMSTASPLLHSCGGGPNAASGNSGLSQNLKLQNPLENWWKWFSPFNLLWKIASPCFPMLSRGFPYWNCCHSLPHLAKKFRKEVSFTTRSWENAAADRSQLKGHEDLA